MKSVLLLLICFYICVVPVFAIGGSLPEFKSVVPVTGGIQLTSWDQGGRFKYKVGEAEEKVEAYGMKITILNEQAARFVTKGLKLIFTPKAGEPGTFIVDRIVDMRSVSGPRTKESFILSVDSGTVSYSEKKIEALND